MRTIYAGRLVVALALGGCGVPPVTSMAEPPVPPGQWSCLDVDGAASPPATLEAQLSAVPFDVALAEAFTHAPVGELDLEVCVRSDEACDEPLSRATADAEGLATLQAPGDASSFDGFVRVSGPDIATHYVFLPHRAATPGSGALPIVLYTPAALQAAARASGLSIDSQTAVVYVDARDCTGAPASGVTVSIGSFGRTTPIVAYAAGDGSSVSRKVGVTDPSGVAVGFDVPDGPIGVADLLGDRRAGGAIAFARAGAVSELVVRP
jgi:hypothetical protein